MRMSGDKLRVIYSPDRYDWAVDVLDHLQKAASQRQEIFMVTELSLCHALTSICSPQLAPRYPSLASALRTQLKLPVSRMVCKTILGWRQVHSFAMRLSKTSTAGKTVRSSWHSTAFWKQTSLSDSTSLARAPCNPDLFILY